MTMQYDHTLRHALFPTVSDAYGNYQIDPTLFNDWLRLVSVGEIPGWETIHKFGAATVGTTIVPIAQSLVYQTPITAQALEFVSSSANDTAAGSGARSVTIIGLDSNWAEVSQTINTNGLTAVPLTTNLTRLYRWYVETSGSYATQSTGSHAGILTIRGASTGPTWSTIPVTPFPRGQSQIGAYTIAANHTAWLISKNVYIDSTKTVDLYFFRREYADTTSAPYSAMKVVSERVGTSGQLPSNFVSLKDGFRGACDVGFMGVVSASTAALSVEFELLVRDDSYFELV